MHNSLIVVIILLLSPNKKWGGSIFQWSDFTTDLRKFLLTLVHIFGFCFRISFVLPKATLVDEPVT